MSASAATEPVVALSTSSAYPASAAQAFALADDLGYDGVEVMVWTDPVTQEAGALKALAEHYGQPVVSVHAPTLLVTQGVWGNDPWGKVDRSIELAGHDPDDGAGVDPAAQKCAQRNVRDQPPPHARLQHDVRPDRAKRADLDPVGKAGAVLDAGSGVDPGAGAHYFAASTAIIAPTSASAIARRMAAVGRVTVSERRSMTGVELGMA